MSSGSWQLVPSRAHSGAVLPPPSQASPDETCSRPHHIENQQWPACQCQLCMDEYICPAALSRIGRALALIAAVGLAAIAVGSL
ncbi:hypothetical protein SAMN06264364_13450 [Quadrisphaera granulorum]|uniref:Uncharacterized protein n=1 Tax=Quadrisphaera granulorum TaxID=317664 RepID=A0A315ZQL0_9ACTN|nr:hypothetical protein BXY45_13450 [Quadrisphaera granulorum]SZE98642.1 hypothetical protein SAMN06264364_13450 [Quadrisphaera granulorum]